MSTTATALVPNMLADRVNDLFMIDYEDIANRADLFAKQNDIKPACSDKLTVAMMLIDLQLTFCHPKGQLYVMGAEEDSVRLCEFIYRNLSTISQIIPTMDTHTANQIFHAMFFISDTGKQPGPGTQITLEDFNSGLWQVNPAIVPMLTAQLDYSTVVKYVRHYLEQLESGDNRISGIPSYALTIWPYHAVLGGIDHALVPIVHEAIWFHTQARRSERSSQIKGGNPLTENYSIMRPEVLTLPSGQPIAQRNSALVKQLLDSDRVIITGQAKSHCVAWTIMDLLDELKQPELAAKVYILEDCTSPVVIPGVLDCTDDANKAFEHFKSKGMHVVKSTTPIDQWPDW